MSVKDWKIVADSSANILELDGVDFESVPMYVHTEERIFRDDASLDMDEMREFFASYKGKSSSACPGVGDWLTAFGDAENIMCITLTGGLSGAANAARVARDEYLADNPDRNVIVLDSLSTGPEMDLLIDYARELILADKTVGEVSEAMTAYSQRTHLLFAFESLKNFAQNGRVNPLLARAVSAMGIRIVGTASVEGTLEPVKKVKGKKPAYSQIVKRMAEQGYRNGPIVITHNVNPEGAQLLAEKVRERFGNVEIRMNEVRGLCNLYAEPGGVLIGYETPDASEAAPGKAVV